MPGTWLAQLKKLLFESVEVGPSLEDQQRGVEAALQLKISLLADK